MQIQTPMAYPFTDLQDLLASLYSPMLSGYHGPINPAFDRCPMVQQYEYHCPTVYPPPVPELPHLAFAPLSIGPYCLANGNGYIHSGVYSGSHLLSHAMPSKEEFL